jgi:hypothetical protein
MKYEAKTVLLLLGISFLYVFGAGGTLFLYIHAHPGGLVPRWISVPVFCLFILTIALMSFLIRRAARKQASVETVEDAHRRRVRAIKALKTGLIVWGLILLNDIRMLLQGTVPWTLAIPGLIIVLLMATITWTSLRRLQKTEGANAGINHSRAPQ